MDSGGKVGLSDTFGLLAKTTSVVIKNQVVQYVTVTMSKVQTKLAINRDQHS